MGTENRQRLSGAEPDDYATSSSDPWTPHARPIATWAWSPLHLTLEFRIRSAWSSPFTRNTRRSSVRTATIAIECASRVGRAVVAAQPK